MLVVERCWLSSGNAVCFFLLSLIVLIPECASYFSLHIAPQQVISLHVMMFLSDTQWEEIIKTIPF